MSRGGLSAPRLAWRTISVSAPISLLVALLTAFAAGVASAVPRWMAEVGTSDLHQSVSSLAEPRRDLVGTSPQPAIGPDPDTSPTTQTPAQLIYGSLDAALKKARARQHEPLRSALGDPHYVMSSTTRTRMAAPAGVDLGDFFLKVAVDPAFAKQVRFVAGSAPRVWSIPAGVSVGYHVIPGGVSLDFQGGTVPPLEIALSVATATTMHLHVGDVLSTGFLGAVRISGLFEPVRPDDVYWQYATGIERAAYSPDDGHHPDEYTATGFSAPESAGSLDGTMTTTAWYPLATAAVTPADARALADGIRGFTHTDVAVPTRQQGLTALFGFGSDLADTIDGSLQRIAATQAILAMCLSGPVGVLVAVLWLGIVAGLRRREAVTALATARGASGTQLRTVAALEGLVVGVPPALVGAVVAALLMPVAGSTVAAWLAPLCIGVVPPVLFAVLGGPRGFRMTRRDVTARWRGGVRAGIRVLVIALALLATVLLVRRGRPDLVDTAFDPLLAATPLLLALAASIVTLWLVPVAMRATSAVARAGRGVVGFVGSVRAIRDPALGIAAALSIVVGISVAVFSTVVLDSVDAGAQQTARQAVGADMRASGPLFLGPQRARIAAIPGVETVAPVANAGGLSLVRGDSSDDTTVLLTDSAVLHRVRSDVPGDLKHRIDGRMPILVSADLAAAHPIGTDGELGGIPVRIVGVLPVAGMPDASQDWVLADRAFLTTVGQGSFTPDILLIGLAPDHRSAAAAAQIAARVRQIVPDTLVDDVPGELAPLESAPAAAALRLALLAAAAIGAVLAALAVFASSAAAGATRNRSVGVLRTMGLSGRSALGLVAWEILPVAIGGVVVGTALGVAMPGLIVATTDLAAFVGSSDLAVVLDPVRLIAVLLGFLVVVAIATALAVLFARRAQPAVTVKMGAE